MKNTVYRIARACGLFRVSRWLLRKQLLILCYHGFEIEDESNFMPGVFMRGSTFQRRMTLLSEQGFAVLSLEKALHHLKQGSLPPNSVVITIDDGFSSVMKIGVPILQALSMPATLYVTTYYAQKGVPIFRLAVQYMFWKTKNDVLSIEDGGLGVSGVFDISNPEIRREVCWKVVRYGESLSSEEQRQGICELIGRHLNVDYDSIRSSRMFDLMGKDELQAVIDKDIDIQLHTHRHRMPPPSSSAWARELRENKQILESWLNKKCTHFCYPSGEWDHEHLPLLSSFGIQSAATCDKGLNRRDTAELLLYRVLDSETLSDIAFEAEVNGFSELLRVFLGRRPKDNKLRKSSAYEMGDRVDVPTS